MHIDEDVHEFLNRKLPGMLAVVGTFAKDGYPQLVPVWFRWDGQEIIIWTLESRAWVQNIFRDPRAGVSVAEEVGSMAVMMRGHASVETSEGQHIDDEVMRITRRYVPESGIGEYIDPWSHLRTMVRIRPRKLYVWR